MDRIREIAKRLKDSRKSWLELALESLARGISYGEVCRILQEEGVSPPSEGYWSNLIRLARWSSHLGIEPDLLSKAGVSKALQLTRIPFDRKEEAESVLLWSVDKSLNEVRVQVAKLLSGGSEPVSEPFVSVRIPFSVHSLFTQARGKMSRVVSLELSETKFLEFLSSLVVHMESQALLKFWKALHGEGEERNIESLWEIAKPSGFSPDEEKD